MKQLIVSAPGKLHLIGEHAVVYGYPAIIAAIDKRTFVLNRHVGMSKQSEDTSRILSGFWTSQNDKFVKICIQEAFNFFKKTPRNLNFSINSEIPIGCGMGSSASIAVCIAGLVSQIINKKIEKEKINEIAYKCEKHVHGNPSGGDNATSTYGGFIWYQKKEKKKIIKSLDISFSKNFLSHFSIINTGRPSETTKDMVDFVAERFKIKDLKLNNIFKTQGQLTNDLLFALEKEDIDSISEIIKKAQSNLERVGVVSDSTKKLIREIENNGGAAKICGAGGVKKASGIVLVFNKNFEQIKKIAKRFGLNCEKIILGEEGVRCEA